MWRRLSMVVCSLMVGEPAYAVPPLVTGDVPTAEKRHVEWYLGTRYQKASTVERQVPFTEVVYGVSDRLEVTAEVPYLSLQGHRGLGDIVLGTKCLFVREAARYPGLAGSFEWKLDNGSQRRGLGTGAMDYDFRLRSQKTWAWLTGIVNVGYTFVGEPKENGVRQKRDDVLFLACAQEYEVAPKTTLLSEVYWNTNEEPGAPNRFAADLGVQYRLQPALTIHAAIGRSLREGHKGGPELRAYLGIKVEFPIGKGGPR